MYFSLHKKSGEAQGFSDGPVVRTLSFRYTGHGFDPSLGTKVSQAMQHGQKI